LARAQAALRALESFSLDHSPNRYPVDRTSQSDLEQEVESRGRLIATLHDRIRVLEHALHLPPYFPLPPYTSYLRPWSPLPLPSDKDLAIRRLLSDNRLLRDAVATLQRAVREYESHVSRLLAVRRGERPPAASAPSSPVGRARFGSASKADLSALRSPPPTASVTAPAAGATPGSAEGILSMLTMSCLLLRIVAWCECALAVRVLPCPS
jgi:hypothetical protein